MKYKLPDSTIVTIVARKGKQKLVKDIKFSERKDYVQKCMKKGWSYRLYQEGFYQELKTEE